MRVDAVLKRFFPVVVLALLAVASYFQASGLGHLLASSTAVPEALPPAAAPVAGRTAAAPPDNPFHTTSGAAILERNPFDSATDLLRVDTAPAVEPPPDEGDPEEDPLCDAVRVVLITQSDDPSWSFASLAGRDGKRILRRVGDEIDGLTVNDIGRDTVWLTSGANRRCKVVMWQEPPKVPDGKTVRVLGPGANKGAPSPKDSRFAAPPEIASGIHKISDTHIEVERRVVDQVMERHTELIRSVRIAPPRAGEKGGLQLQGIRPQSLLDLLGLKTGDLLRSVNGIEMSTDPQKALVAFAQLRSATQLRVSVLRGGKPVTIDIQIK